MLENRYLKVTLVPEFGGRILSIIYKPTGHEQLYRTQVGVPYGMTGGTFYYDWMMVLGGIFPTFPGCRTRQDMAETVGLSEVLKRECGRSAVSMSLKDDFAYSAAPRRLRRGSTGIEAATTITLKADRAALDTRVVLKNPQDKAIDYEYWTCTTLAGIGSATPQDNGGAEIIAPIQAYSTPSWSANLAGAVESLGQGKPRFEQLRYFENGRRWASPTPAPDMQGGNFWGVINHDNEGGSSASPTTRSRRA